MKRNRIASKFKVGLQHISKKEVCHDRAQAVKIGNITILALADGMGCPAFRCPEIGAQFATDYIRNNGIKLYKLLKKAAIINDQGNFIFKDKDQADNFMEQFTAWLFDMNFEAHSFAKNIGVDLNDLHCTLSFAIIGPEFFITASIGDSPVYLTQNGKTTMVYGNGDIRIVDQGTNSAFNITRSIHEIDVAIGATNSLDSILMISDGCLGFEKVEELALDSTPKWFDDVRDGKMTDDEAINHLVNIGYDDCSFAYFIN